ncbi:MAG TPA: peptidoglycan editing factor PgeF [Thermomicrobiaceae bacterium]|nr:peptidoglycan editing factor PgeF [Thermomicrobiaceae bacterium]
MTETDVLAPLRSELLSRAGVVHGVTHRTSSMPLGGDVSYVSGASDTSAVAANRDRWSERLGTTGERWVCAQQVHGVSYSVTGEADAGRGARSFEDAIPDTDILMSQTPGLALTVFCADCTPVLLWDPVRRAATAVHAGWRGTVKNAAGAAVSGMRHEFGSEPSDLVAFIGPSIGPCCYEVGGEVFDFWRAGGLDPEDEAVNQRDGRSHFDLWTANRLALLNAGVPSENIEVAGQCTMCHPDRWFSHRASKGSAGRFAALIVVPPATPRQA